MIDREKEDVTELSTLGHFLKGSSAACGVIKVRDSCEYMQHYGKLKDEKGVHDLERDAALKKLKATLDDVKEQYKEAEVALRAFYGEEAEEEPAPEAKAQPTNGDEKAAEPEAKDEAAPAAATKATETETKTTAAVKSD